MSSNEKNAKFYFRISADQRSVTKTVLDEILPNIVWRQSEGHKILDIGCGYGNVTKEVLMPMLPKNFEKILGVDVEIQYVEFAQNEYANSDERIAFAFMNIEHDLNTEYEEQFDLVTSFYCVHLLDDYSKALQNMGKCVKPGGNLIITFICRPQFDNSLFETAQMPKSEPKIQDLAEFISSASFIEAQENDHLSIIESAGFRIVSHKQLAIHEVTTRTKNNLRGEVKKQAEPSASRMSEGLQGELSPQTDEERVNRSLTDTSPKKNNYKSSVMVIHAEKIITA